MSVALPRGACCYKPGCRGALRAARVPSWDGAHEWSGWCDQTGHGWTYGAELPPAGALRVRFTDTSAATLAHRRCDCADRVDRAFTVLGNPGERELNELARRAS